MFDEQGSQSGCGLRFGIARRALAAWIAAGVFALGALGCGSLQEVPYVPQPGRVSDPVHKLQELIASQQAPKPVKVEVTETRLAVTYSVGGEAETKVVERAAVADVKVRKNDTVHFGKLYDGQGAELFSFESPEEPIVLRFVDAIAAWRAAKAPVAPP
jgi:hypothetical protein